MKEGNGDETVNHSWRAIHTQLRIFTTIRYVIIFKPWPVMIKFCKTLFINQWGFISNDWKPTYIKMGFLFLPSSKSYTYVDVNRFHLLIQCLASWNCIYRQLWKAYISSLTVIVTTILNDNNKRKILIP